MALAASGQAHSATVFQSFSNYENAGDTPGFIANELCSTCGAGYGSVYARFTLTSAETLNKAFFLFSGPTRTGSPVPGAFTLALFNNAVDGLPVRDSGGTPLPPFLIQTSALTSATSEVGGMMLGEFDLPNWSVGPGTYWLKIFGFSTLIPTYHTNTPLHTAVAGSPYAFEHSISYYAANDAIGFSLNGVDPVVGGGVPEPATWALMLAGFGLVGSALRRRQSAGGRLA